jgi:hypothetical protein
MSDFSDLTPAPWECDLRDSRWDDETHYVVTGPDGKVLFDTVNSEAALLEYDEHWFDRVGGDNLKFAALARNAFDVMQRRGWGVARCGSHGWCAVQGQDGPDQNPSLAYIGFEALDPFMALCEAEKWYVANVEQPASEKGR